jgi:tmRNA-binding protein
MNLLNKKANYTYKLEPERVEAGLSLTGGEAKAVRTGHADLNQAVARIVDGEAILHAPESFSFTNKSWSPWARK